MTVGPAIAGPTAVARRRNRARNESLTPARSQRPGCVGIAVRRLSLSPAEFVQSGVVDTEVVADLVDDGPAYLLDNVQVGATDGADGLAVDGDAVGQRARVLG